MDGAAHVRRPPPAVVGLVALVVLILVLLLGYAALGDLGRGGVEGLPAAGALLPGR